MSFRQVSGSESIPDSKSASYKQLETILNTVGSIAENITAFNKIEDKGDIEFFAMGYGIALISEILTPHSARPIDKQTDYKKNIEKIMKEYKLLSQDEMDIKPAFEKIFKNLKKARDLLADDISRIEENNLKMIIQGVTANLSKLSNFSTSIGNEKKERDIKANMSVLEEIAKNPKKYCADMNPAKRFSIIISSLKRIEELKNEYERCNPSNAQAKTMLFYAISMLYVIVGENGRHLEDIGSRLKSQGKNSLAEQLVVIKEIRDKTAHLNLFFKKNIDIDIQQLMNHSTKNLRKSLEKIVPDFKNAISNNSYKVQSIYLIAPTKKKPLQEATPAVRTEREEKLAEKKEPIIEKRETPESNKEKEKKLQEREEDVLPEIKKGSLKQKEEELSEQQESMLALLSYGFDEENEDKENALQEQSAEKATATVSHGKDDESGKIEKKSKNPDKELEIQEEQEGEESQTHEPQKKKPRTKEPLQSSASSPVSQPLSASSSSSSSSLPVNAVLDPSNSAPSMPSLPEQAQQAIKTATGSGLASISLSELGHRIVKKAENVRKNIHGPK